MRIFLFIVLSLLASCAPIKIKKIPMPDGDIQDIKGHVKEIKVKNIKGSSVIDPETIPFELISNWNREGRKIAQKDLYAKDYFDETLFFYQNGLVIKSITKSNTNSPELMMEHKYDKKSNEIEYLAYFDKKLNNKRVTQYDKRGNRIVVEHFDGNGELKFTEKTTIDYKNKSLITYSYNKQGELKDGYLKCIFDKNGNRIKSELEFKKAKYYSVTINEYDKRNNLLKTFSLPKTPKNIVVEYKYSFDKIGNIIKQEKFENNVLVNTVLIDIVYW
ncbi:hypothetical protein [Flavobacterium xueshanense]|nr:hypothetical protein [Flavobacterium xueshanense]